MGSRSSTTELHYFGYMKTILIYNNVTKRLYKLSEFSNSRLVWYSDDSDIRVYVIQIPLYIYSDVIGTAGTTIQVISFLT